MSAREKKKGKDKKRKKATMMFKPAMTIMMAAALMSTVATSKASFYELSAVDTDGKNVSLSSLQGQVTMVINVATY